MLTYKMYQTCDKKAIHTTRLEMVRSAQRIGIKATAKVFGVVRNTVRLWLRRYLEDPQRPLLNRRPTTTNHPFRVPDEWVEKICTIVRTRIHRRQKVCVAHLQKMYCIPYSIKTINNILKRNNLYQSKKRRKKQVKRDMRYMNDTLRFCERIQVDIKYLSDIAWLKWGIIRTGLPKYQITARDCATGAIWLGYAKEKSTTNTALFIEWIFAHLQYNGVCLHDVAIQTDNGKEFTTWWDSPKETLFEQVIARHGATHRRIPFGACTYNSMVEASHRLIETECYDDMYLPTYQGFFHDVAHYQRHFNLERVNTYRGANPLALFIEKAPHVHVDALILKPIIVDTLLTRERYRTWRTWQDSIP